MQAVIETELGHIRINLFQRKAPNTVRNFVDLAEGKKKFLDHETGQLTTRPFYNGLTFFRVIQNFLIQSGCPYGTGQGGPGYRFPDEIDPSTNKHNKIGMVSMANSGPGTNGSQFFITLSPAPWLDNGHTIFGEVSDGIDVVKQICAGEVIGDRPLSPFHILKITIIR